MDIMFFFHIDCILHDTCIQEWLDTLLVLGFDESWLIYNLLTSFLLA